MSGVQICAVLGVPVYSPGAALDGAVLIKPIYPISFSCTVLYSAVLCVGVPGLRTRR